MAIYMVLKGTEAQKYINNKKRVYKGKQLNIAACCVLLQLVCKRYLTVIEKLKKRKKEEDYSFQREPKEGSIRVRLCAIVYLSLC